MPVEQVSGSSSWQYFWLLEVDPLIRSHSMSERESFWQHTSLSVSLAAVCSGSRILTSDINHKWRLPAGGTEASPPPSGGEVWGQPCSGAAVPWLFWHIFLSSFDFHLQRGSVLMFWGVAQGGFSRLSGWAVSLQISTLCFLKEIKTTW